MLRPLLLAGGMILVLTVFFFPTSQPGAIIDLGSGEKLATSRVVTLSPVLTRFTGRELYSVIVSPSLNRYAENMSSSRQIALVKTGVTMRLDGSTVSAWSFEWLYWFLVVLLPSAIIGFIVWWKLKPHEIDQI